MNIYRNAFRAITNRYLDDFEFSEQKFEEEDGIIQPDFEAPRDDEEPPVKEAA